MNSESEKSVNKLNPKLFIRGLNILFCLFFVLLLIIYANLGRIVSPLIDTELIKKNIAESTGLKLEMDSLSFFTTKDLCISLKSESIKLLSPEENKSLFYIKDAGLKIKILPLLFKKIEIKRLEASNFEVAVERYKDGRFNFEKYFNKKGNFPFVFGAKSASMLLDKYYLTFKDDINGNMAEIDGFDLVSTEFNLDSYADIKTRGQVKFSNKAGMQVSPYALDIKLKFPLNKNLDFKDYRLIMSLSDIDLSYLLPYANEFITKDIKALKGKGSLVILPKEGENSPLLFKLSLENLYLDIFKNKHNNIINIPSSSTLSAVLGFKKDTVFIDDFNFNKKEIDISAKGTLKNLTNLNTINPDILFKISNSSLNEMLKATPGYLIKMQQDYIPNLKKYNANALVNGEFRVKDRLKFPNMYGTIKLDDVCILNRPSNAKTSSGKVDFSGSDVDILVNANLPNNEKLIVKGKTEIKPLPFAKFDIQSTPNIDLAFAHRILIPIHKIFGFQLGPLPFMEIAGNGQISLATEGTRESANLNGYFKTKNASARLQGLNTQLTGGVLNLLFKGKNITFDNTTGFAEGAKVKIDGSSTVTGDLDLYVNVYDVNAKKALNVVKTSEMTLALLNGGTFLDAYTNPKGNIDFKLHLWGKASDMGDELKFEPSDTMQAKGSVIFKNNSVNIFPEIKASKINGTLDFTDFTTLNLVADIYSSPFNVTGTIKPDTGASKNRAEQPQIIDLLFKTKNASSLDLYKFFYDNQDGFQSKNKISRELYDFLNKIKFKFAADIRAKGKVDPHDTILDMKKFTLEGWAVGLNYKESDVLFNSGMVRFKDQKLLFKDLNTSIWNANIVTNGGIDKIFDDVFLPELNFNPVSFPFSKITEAAGLSDNKNLKKLLNDFSDFKGVINGNFSYNSKGFSGGASLNNISLYDKKRALPVTLNSGDLKFSNNKLKLNALNLLYGTTPVYLDAVLSDFNTLNKPDFNVFLTTNLNEESLDKLVNPNLEFPVKTKGEFTLKGRLRGTLDNYTAFATMLLNPGVDLYYMGANLGDVSNKREFNARIDFKDDEVNIKNIKYLKYILSQNNKETPYEMINFTGGLKMDKGAAVLKNVKIHTPNPAPARLLNPVFKKSVLKQGTFTADVALNGPALKPDARGKVKFSNVDIPLYDANIRDIDLTLNDDVINAVFDGTGMSSDIKVAAEIVNKPDLPVIINNAEISSKTIDLGTFMKNLSRFAKGQKTADPSPKAQFTLSPGDLEVKNGTIKADEIVYNNIKASNVSGAFKHTKDRIFRFDNVVFNTAGGKIKSSGSYEFDTTKFTINSVIENCDANTLVTDLFGTKNQIFGKTNGKIYLTGRELNTSGGINTVKATVDFGIYDGKMPKLGSLEYLLRAGNLLKSGILGFTINNVIEVLIPYKTGEFRRITGDFIVEDGKVDKLNIYSQGDNLSIYTNGSYDIATNIGDFEVLGKLSTKISNLLGPIGNASVYSLVNIFTNNKMDKQEKEDFVQNAAKVPDLTGGSADFRLFTARILGDLNADNFVKSFNWLN